MCNLDVSFPHESSKQTCYKWKTSQNWPVSVFVPRTVPEPAGPWAWKWATSLSAAGWRVRSSGRTTPGSLRRRTASTPADRPARRRGPSGWRQSASLHLHDRGTGPALGFLQDPLRLVWIEMNCGNNESVIPRSRCRVALGVGRSRTCKNLPPSPRAAEGRVPLHYESACRGDLIGKRDNHLQPCPR